MNSKTLFLTLIGMLLALTVSAKATVEEVDRCNTVEISGYSSVHKIKITALSGSSQATKGMAFVTLPGKEDLTVKGFKYLLDGLEEGCFGVIENYQANGKKYPAAALIVAFEADSEGVTVQYSISSGEEDLGSGSFRLKSVAYSNPLDSKDKAGYTDDNWAEAYANFGYWLIGHVEEYKE